MLDPHSAQDGRTRYQKRVAIAFVGWSLFYLLLPEWGSILEHGILRAYYWRGLSVALNPLLFLVKGTKGHLWFLVALFYGITLLGVIRRAAGGRWASVFGLVCLVAYPFAWRHLRPLGWPADGFNPYPGFIMACGWLTLGGWLSQVCARSLAWGAAFLVSGAVLAVVIPRLAFFEIPCASGIVLREAARVTICSGLLLVSLHLPSTRLLLTFAKLGRYTLGVYGVHFAVLSGVIAFVPKCSSSLYLGTTVLLTYVIALLISMACSQFRYLRPLFQ